MSGCIVGWAHSKFGKHEGKDIEQLIVEVTQAALADAGVAAADIDTVYLGTMNGGFVRQEFPASLVLQADPGFRFKPATRVEDACATGSAAIHQGLNAIAAGKARLALVVGVEKMTEVSGAKVGDILLGASYRKEEDAIEGGFAGIFGQIAQSYFQRYGDQSDALARIAAKNHKNGVANPLAQMQKDLGYEFCRTVSDKNPIVAGPLKRTDCSLVSDGAAAVVLADTATALSMKKAVIFRAAEQVNDFLPMSRRDVIAFEGSAIAPDAEDLGYEFCDRSARTRSRRRSSGRLSLVPMRRAVVCRHGDGLEPEEGGDFPRRRAGQRLSADEPARRDRLRGRARLAAGVR